MKTQPLWKLGAVVIGVALVLLAGRNRHEVLVSTTELEQLPKFRGVFEQYYARETGKGSVQGVWIMAESGKRLFVGIARPGEDLAAFARQLESGKTYEFPKVWLDYKAGTAKLGER